MKELLVASAASSYRKLMGRLELQYQKAGITYYIEPLDGNIPNAGYGSLQTKLSWIRRICDAYGSSFRKIVFADAHDLLFYGTEDEVVRKVPDNYVIFGMERACWPFGLRKGFDHTKRIPTPWRYINGGLMAGTPAALMDWCYQVEHAPVFHAAQVDQHTFQLLWMLEAPYMRGDTDARLFYNMAREQWAIGQPTFGIRSLWFMNGRPYNSWTRSFPNFVHFPGFQWTRELGPFLDMEERSKHETGIVYPRELFPWTLAGCLHCDTSSMSPTRDRRSGGEGGGSDYL